MHCAGQACGADLPAARKDALLSAELTAQVVCGALADTAAEVIDICRTLPTDVTLLKGISVSHQHYPAAHLRPMSDIDVLIDPTAYQSVEAALLRQGYGRDPSWPAGLVMHHGTPLFHPGRRVWVELHTRLFPEGSDVGRGLIFSPSNVAALSVGSSFGGRPVRRLTNELQLVYIATTWMRDLVHGKMQPSYLNALLDVVHLLRTSGLQLGWGPLLQSVDNDMVAAFLYVTLGYVARHGLGHVAPEALPKLAARQKLVGALQMKLIHATLDRYLIGARPWNLVLPPPVPARYSLRYQLKKRWGLLLPG